ncbi:MAG: cysteine-rich CWC family protein [Chitinophagales bacterium]|nr:cysteine-rich CWC family protein [Chitinophagales bacterium]MDW8418719.1 cysteine-rich CWC family protein [Chitinophagales bacterium]
MKHEIKTCPRCGNVFECKVGDIANCQCNIPLSDRTKKFLAGTYYDCLCASCLLHFEKLNAIASKQTFPVQSELLIEGLHYYRENGCVVFTELYHLLRGFCCNSGCRHCVYGYKNRSTSNSPAITLTNTNIKN